jgi:hypothetical protein
VPLRRVRAVSTSAGAASGLGVGGSLCGQCAEPARNLYGKTAALLLQWRGLRSVSRCRESPRPRLASRQPVPGAPRVPPCGPGFAHCLSVGSAGPSRVTLASAVTPGSPAAPPGPAQGGPRARPGLSRRLDGASCRFPAARWSIEPAGCAAPNHAGSGQDRSSAPGAPLSTRAHSRHPPSPSRLKTLELTAAHLAAVLGVRMSVRTVEVDVGMAGRFADECQRQAAHQ